MAAACGNRFPPGLCPFWIPDSNSNDVQVHRALCALGFPCGVRTLSHHRSKVWLTVNGSGVYWEVCVNGLLHNDCCDTTTTTPHSVYVNNRLCAFGWWKRGKCHRRHGAAYMHVANEAPYGPLHFWYYHNGRYFNELADLNEIGEVSAF